MNENLERQRLALPGARFVWNDSERGLWYVWHGGHTVNIYDLDWNPITCFSIGDFASSDPVPFELAREEIETTIAEGIEY